MPKRKVLMRDLDRLVSLSLKVRFARYRIEDIDPEAGKALAAVESQIIKIVMDIQDRNHDAKQPHGYLNHSPPNAVM